MVFFLTGTTGFVGGELLILLSQRPDIRKIFCLVRAASHEDGLARLKKVFALYNDRFDEEKIIPVIGNLADPALASRLIATPGLADVNHIVHCAANTSFAKIQDDQVEAINVGGLTSILTWAQTLRDLSLFTYVGTATICGCNITARLIREDESPNNAAKRLVKYTYTKMIGELNIAAHLPAEKTLIVRPSIIMGDSRDRKPRSNVILWTLATGNFLRLIPVNADAQLDIVPIDYVVKAIEGLIFAQRRHHVYHISAGPQGVTTPRQLTDAIAPFFPGRPPFVYASGSLISAMKNWSRGRNGTGHELANYQEHLDYLVTQLGGRREQLRIILAGFEPYVRFIELGHVFDNTRILADTPMGQSVPAHQYVAACANYIGDIDIFEGALDP